MALQVAAHGHVELLIGATQLQIRLHLHRVVALQQRIKKLVQGDGGARAVAIGKVLLGQHLAHGADAQQLNHLGQVKPGEPLAVAAHLQPARSLEIKQGALAGLALTQLLQVSGGIGLHRSSAELHPGGALAGGIADAGGEVADDQHGDMAGILEGPQLAEQQRVPQVDIGAGGVDAELDAQGPPGPLGLFQASG